MLTTLQAVIATAIGIVPGAVYVAAYDGQLGQGRSSFPDQLTRYLTHSAAIHALLALPTYHILNTLLAEDSAELFAQRPWLLYVLGLTYVVVPAALGAGNAALTRVTGRSPILALLAQFFGTEAFEAGASAPSSRDHLFAGRTPGYVRVRLKRGGWLGGFWGTHERREIVAHASLYPEARELFLPHLIEIDEKGNFVLDAEGHVQVHDEGLLIRWDDIDVLKFAYVGNVQTDGNPVGDDYRVNHSDESDD